MEKDKQLELKIGARAIRKALVHGAPKARGKRGKARKAKRRKAG